MHGWQGRLFAAVLMLVAGSSVAAAAFPPVPTAAEADSIKRQLCEGIAACDSLWVTHMAVHPVVQFEDGSARSVRLTHVTLSRGTVRKALRDSLAAELCSGAMPDFERTCSTPDSTWEGSHPWIVSIGWRAGGAAHTVQFNFTDGCATVLQSGPLVSLDIRRNAERLLALVKAALPEDATLRRRVVGSDRPEYTIAPWPTPERAH